MRSLFDTWVGVGIPTGFSGRAARGVHVGRVAVRTCFCAVDGVLAPDVVARLPALALGSATSTRCCIFRDIDVNDLLFFVLHGELLESYVLPQVVHSIIEIKRQDCRDVLEEPAHVLSDEVGLEAALIEKNCGEVQTVVEMILLDEPCGLISVCLCEGKVYVGEHEGFQFLCVFTPSAGDAIQEGLRIVIVVGEGLFRHFFCGQEGSVEMGGSFVSGLEERGVLDRVQGQKSVVLQWQ